VIEYEVPVGRYAVTARYGTFEETKEVEVGAGKEVLVEFRWYTKPPTPAPTTPTLPKELILLGILGLFALALARGAKK